MVRILPYLGPNQVNLDMEQDKVLDGAIFKDASQVSRTTFMRKTYTHLAGALLVFLVVETLFLQSKMIVGFMLSMLDGYLWLAVLGGFMLVTTMAEKWVAQAQTTAMQYGGFLLYIVAQALIFVPLMYILMAQSGGGEVLTKAFVVTTALFAGLSAVALTTKKDFSFMRSVLMVGGFLAIGLIVAGMIFGFDLGLWFSFGMVVLAGVSILYQTSNMIHKYDTSQHVIASLGLFASFMLMLWYVIRIFMSRD